MVMGGCVLCYENLFVTKTLKAIEPHLLSVPPAVVGLYFAFTHQTHIRMMQGMPHSGHTHSSCVYVPCSLVAHMAFAFYHAYAMKK